MNIEQLIPYSWLRTLPTATKSFDEIPLWGYPPPFPWENFSNLLAESLKIPGFTLIKGESTWLSAEELAKEAKSYPLALNFIISPLEGDLFWLFSPSDLKDLLLISLGDSKNLESFIFPDMEKEFYRFLGLEVIENFKKLNYEPTFNPQILEDIPLPDSTCLKLELILKTEQREFTTHLIITPEFRTSFHKKYANKTLSYPKGLTENVTIEMQLLGGRVSLTHQEWHLSQPGDFILLDECFLSLEENKSRILLTVNNQILFRGKLKDGNIKVLESPFLQEAPQSMAKLTEEDEEEDFDFDADSTDFEESEDSLTDTDQETEEDLTEDEHTLSDLEESEHAESEYRETEVEEEPIEKDNSVALSSLSTKNNEVKQKEPFKSPAANSSKSFLKPEEIPLTIAIEVGRIQMSIQKLIELQPGNLLELNIHPEDGVDLMVNNRCIGKAELLKLGDSLGIRILDKA